MTHAFLSPVIALLYALAAFMLFGNLRKSAMASIDAFENAPDTSHTDNRMPLLIAVLALLLHALLTLSQAGFPGALQLPFFVSLSAMGATVVAIQLLLCLKWQAAYLGIAVFPIAGICAIAVLLAGSSSATLATHVQLHVLFSMTAYAMLALAALQAMLVAAQRHFLNQHRPGGLIRSLPPLTSTETLLFVLLGTGFLLLSLALASGFISLDNMFAQNVAHKTILSCLAWVIFAVLLFGRWRFGWRGQRAVRWTLVGFVVLVVAYFGSKFVLELLLDRA